MSVKTLRRWTCNRCHRDEETPPSSTPAYWYGVAINPTAPDGSFDHGSWRRYHLCHPCRTALTEFMGVNP